MGNQQKTFDRLHDKLWAIVDLISSRHKGGVDYGSGDRLTPVEAHTIQAVGDNQGLNLTALANTMNVTKATMSERVNKLVKLDLIRKSKALDNRKEILMTLTESGRIVQTGHEEAHKRMFQKFASHYGERTEAQLQLFDRAFGEYLTLIQSIERR